MEFSFQTLPKLLYKQFCDREGREPLMPLALAPFNPSAFLSPEEGSKFIWYGHSAVLLRIHNSTLLIDPMLGPNASPIAPFATKRFTGSALHLINDFPEIDILLLTHDHYDHIDYESIQRLKSKVRRYYVALGVGRHLVEWGIPESAITEFDWWDNQSTDSIDITFTPTRHFSGRGLTDRAKSLWGGWAFKTPTEQIYFSGDGGYGKHFKEIGKKIGEVDFAFMECGQYNPNWHQIHLYPEESVQAALDVNARKVMPIHWAGFSLAQHHWTEPVRRFTAQAEKENLPFITPGIGQLVSTHQTIQREPWWAEE